MGDGWNPRTNRLRISAPGLYEADYDSDSLIRVEVVDEDGPIERLTDVIAQGEELRRELPEMPDEDQLATSRRSSSPLVR